MLLPRLPPIFGKYFNSFAARPKGIHALNLTKLSCKRGVISPFNSPGYPLKNYDSIKGPARSCPALFQTLTESTLNQIVAIAQNHAGHPEE
jgi:hypothetical protein